MPHEKDDAPWLNTTYDGFMTHEEMLEEAARREAALKAVDKLYEENGDAMKQLAEIEKEERERPFYRFFAIEYFATGEGRVYDSVC